MTSLLGWLPELSTGTTLSLIVATVAVVSYFIYSQLSGGDNWEKYGVKSGNMGITDFRTGLTKVMNEHGDTVGLQRASMTLVTRELDLIKQIMVKDFNSFVDRSVNFNTKSLIAKGLFFLAGQDWRRMRQILSPSFSTGKLKNISAAIDDTAKKLIDLLVDCAKTDKLVPIKDSAGQYTSEIIAKTAFGLNADCIGHDKEEFYSYTKSLFKKRGPIMTKVAFFFFRFPFIQKFLVKRLGLSFFDGVSQDTDAYLNSVLHTSIAERQRYELQGGKKPADFLQSLVTAQIAGDRAVDEAVAQAGHKADVVKETKAKTMTRDELIGQSLLVIFAAFETTATTLQMCLYLLAKHPDIQEKVIQEIDEVVRSDSPSHEELTQLKYTEQVINETLRLFPPAAIVTRKAMETKTYDSITIPKDASVIIPIFLIHLDPRNFPDPEKFDPDRFSEESKAKRHPLAFIPFGFGPRLCIGMRLAYLELKIALVRIFKTVRFELNDRTEPKRGESVKMKSAAGGLINLEKPIQLQVCLRD